MNRQRAGWVVLGLMLWSTAQGIDPELYQKYKKYKSYQQSQQVETLSLARSAALSGDFEQAEQHLAAARNMAYAPDEIRAVEKLIEEERERRARLAREERERQQRLAEEERSARDAAAQAAASSEAGSTGTDSQDTVEVKLDWGYNYSSIYIPPTYKSRLERVGLFSSEYQWVTSEDLPGYTKTNLSSLYVAVNLKNNSSERMRVRYKITAREKFSISRASGNIVETGIFAIAGAGLASWLDADPKAGAALGAAASVGTQASENRWFNKEKTFTTILEPNEVRYETGRFPANKTLSEAPKITILNVEEVD